MRKVISCAKDLLEIFSAKTCRIMKEELEKRRINTWNREKSFSVGTMKEILRGFHSSRKPVVFLTRRYIERIVDPENDMIKKFRLGMNSCRDDIIAVSMKETLLNSSVWLGTFAECKVEMICLFDFSNPRRMHKNFDKW